VLRKPRDKRRRLWNEEPDTEPETVVESQEVLDTEKRGDDATPLEGSSGDRIEPL
jgi:hypothetical protein